MPLDARFFPKPGQCVITVREDFLESSLANSTLWVSNLYVTIIAADKNHSTLMAAHGGDMYLTDMTFHGDGQNARAIDIAENRRVFVSGALPNTCLLRFLLQNFR